MSKENLDWIEGIRETWRSMRVSGWQYTRNVFVRNDSLEVQITRLGKCTDCPTCSARWRHCLHALTGKEFTQARAVFGSKYLILPYPPEAARDNESIASFLSAKLNLEVNIA